MTNGLFESPVVVNHGDTYNEKEAMQERYPYVLCPECLSQNTEIVRTGDHDTQRKGIWVYDVTRVHYCCKDCKCKYYQWVATDRHFLLSNINIDDCVRDTLMYIAILLAFVVMWVFSWCVCYNNPDPEWWIVAMGIIGPTVSCIMLFRRLLDL